MTLLDRFLMNLAALEGLPPSTTQDKAARIKLIQASSDEEVTDVLSMYIGGTIMLRNKEAYEKCMTFEGTEKELLIMLVLED